MTEGPRAVDEPELALEELLSDMRREFPRFSIVPKCGSAISRAIDIALRIITLGRQSHYLTHYHTVLGDTLYVPASWELTTAIDRAITLRHERVHLRQRRRYTMVGLAVIYLLPFVPLGLAWGRARIEWEAYEETLRATAELRGLEAARSRVLRERIVDQFVGPAYGWMWPFRRSVERWVDEALERIALELSEDERKLGESAQTSSHCSDS